MQPAVKTFTHSSNELFLHAFIDPNFVIAEYHCLKDIAKEDYLDFLRITGQFMSEHNTGRLLADFSSLKDFPFELRATAINNFRQLIIDHVPFLLLAILKPKVFLPDLILEGAIEIAKPLSRRFIDGQVFSNKTEAISWLTEYPGLSPAQLAKSEGRKV
jgi:hypothetical protein